MTEDNDYADHLQNVENIRLNQLNQNLSLKDSMETNIKSKTDFVHNTNYESRLAARNNSISIVKNIDEFRTTDLNNKQQNANNMMSQRKNKEAKSRFDRDQMYDSILRASQ